MRIRSQEIVLLFLFFLESDLKFAQPTKLWFPLLVFLSFFFCRTLLSRLFALYDCVEVFSGILSKLG